MSLPAAIEEIRFKEDSHGVLRVGGTRVTLDTLIYTFLDGATAEEIVYQYPSLDLADVYSVIGYYLHHRTEIEEYLQQREEQAEKVREMNESRFNPQGIRERLLARKKRQG